jgi:predicted extracellular nuclease
LTLSPGRVDPTNPAWEATRKPLAGEFVWNDKTLIVIVNHFSSKGGDDPLFGRWQPPIRSTEVARHQQAASVNAFVDSILAAERKANVVVLGDINDFEFSETTQILVDGGVLTSLMDTLPKPERYSYVFEGNSQVLDQILFSANMMRGLTAYDVVHVNAEFFDQASDHDPSVARTMVFGGGGG